MFGLVRLTELRAPEINPGRTLEPCPVISMAISQVFFIASVDKVGIAISSLHLNFSPFYVMIILFILGGAWDLRAAVGASIVAFGVWLAQSK